MYLSPLPAEGDSPIFAGFTAKIGTVPVNGGRYRTASHSATLRS